jgi:hypothetical protein
LKKAEWMTGGIFMHGLDHVVKRKLGREEWVTELLDDRLKDKELKVKRE